jgi:uncharacterized protein (TIGR04255 family)
MARQRHLPHAPIREAVIDIAATTNSTFEAVQRLAERLEGRFSSRVDLWQNSIGFSFDQHGHSSTTTARNRLGVRLDASPHVLQIRTNGLTFSRLAPYEDWAQISSQAKEWWTAYSDCLNVVEVTKVAVRYVNSMPIPQPYQDFGCYLTCPPKIPTALPQTVGGFLHQTTIVDGSVERLARVTQALEPSPNPTGPLTILLDIDVSQQKSFGAKDPAIWQVLDGLRDFKNNIFFEYITETTAGYFE